MSQWTRSQNQYYDYATPASPRDVEDAASDEEDITYDQGGSYAAQYGSKARTGPLSASTGPNDDGLDDPDAEDHAEDLDPTHPEYQERELSYNPDDFVGLNVPPQVKELFAYITMHQPEEMPLATRLQPFIPDYIPSISEPDVFLKMPRPDQKEDYLGLKQLDEPALEQSDPTVFGLQLRRVTKKAGLDPVAVRGIENAAANPQRIQAWMNNVEVIHKSNPLPTVTYSKPMPNLATLLKVWPSDFEAALANLELPTGDINLDVSQFAKLACAICDIPVHDNKLIESLHMLFSLYTELKSNSHFQHH